MKRVSLLVIFCLVSCSNSQDNILRLEAQLVYLNVQTGKMTDKDGKAYFREMGQDTVTKLYKILSERLSQLELDDTKPEKHFDAKCRHSLGMCEIRDDIKLTTKVLSYMLEARKKPN